MNFLDKHIFTDKKIQSYINKRNKYLEKAKSKGFENCESDISRLRKTCGKLFEERKKQKGVAFKEIKKKGVVTGIEASLEKYGKKSGKPVFKVKIKRENGMVKTRSISLARPIYMY